jgi:hypothetical protein
MGWDQIETKPTYETLGLNYAELTKHVEYSIKNCVWKSFVCLKELCAAKLCKMTTK